MRTPTPADWLALTSLMATTSGFMVAPLISPYVTAELQADVATAGILVGLMSLTSFSSKIPISLYVSTRNIESWLVISLAINALCLAGYYFSPNYLIFAVFRLINGVAMALELTTMLTLSGISAKSDVEMASSVQKFTAATAMGLALGPLAGTLPVATLGIRITFIVAALIASVSLLPALMYQRDTRGLWIGHSPSKFSLRELTSLLCNRQFKWATAVYLSFAIFAGVLFAYGSLRLVLGFGLPDYWISLMFFIYFLTSTLVRVFLRSLMNSLGIIHLLTLGLAAAGIALAILGLGSSPIIAPIGFILGGLGHGVVFPLTALVVAKVIPPGHKFAANSIYLTAFDIGFLMGPSISALLVLLVGLAKTLVLVALAPLSGIVAVKKLSGLGVQ